MADVTNTTDTALIIVNYCGVFALIFSGDKTHHAKHTKVLLPPLLLLEVSTQLRCSYVAPAPLHVTSQQLRLTSQHHTSSHVVTLIGLTSHVHVVLMETLHVIQRMTATRQVREMSIHTTCCVIFRPPILSWVRARNFLPSAIVPLSIQSAGASDRNLFLKFET